MGYSMIEQVSCVIRLKKWTAEPTPEQQLQCLADLAAEVKATFGEGGNAEAPIVEEYIGFVNSPIQSGYVRVLIGKAFGMALEYIQDHGGSEHADLIQVEWEGQEMFHIADNPDGTVEYLCLVPAPMRVIA